MRKFFIKIILPLFLGIQHYSWSQNLQSPGNWPIISDYGPRQLDSTYDWHRGIDYDGNAGDIITSVGFWGHQVLGGLGFGDTIRFWGQVLGTPYEIIDDADADEDPSARRVPRRSFLAGITNV